MRRRISNYGYMGQNKEATLIARMRKRGKFGVPDSLPIS